MTDRVDLHIHTSYSSDGDHCPHEILRMAHDLRLRAISITDHDSVEGSRLALLSCKDYGLEVLPAVEITTFFRGKELHIIGYFIDVNAPSVLNTLALIRQFDEARSQQIILLLQGMGVDVTYEEVKTHSPNAAPKCSLIVKAAIANGRNTYLPLFQPYINGSRSDQPHHNFFLDYMRPGGAAYVEPPMRYSSVEAIELILAHGGVPILAHPGGSLALPDDFELVGVLCHNGLCGLEVYSSYHAIKDERVIEDYCTRQGLVMTAGSDFHGATIKPNIRLGDITYNSYALVETLKEHRRIVLRA